MSPFNQNAGPTSRQQRPENQESLAGHWQQIMDSAQPYWSHLTDADIEYARQGRPQLIEALCRRYGFTEHEADCRIEEFLNHPKHKGLFERMTEINGNLRLNQYVSNPAPGPSAREDQPPAGFTPDKK
jgi:hypothetical protein